MKHEAKNRCHNGKKTASTPASRKTTTNPPIRPVTPNTSSGVGSSRVSQVCRCFAHFWGAGGFLRGFLQGGFLHNFLFLGQLLLQDLLFLGHQIRVVTSSDVGDMRGWIAVAGESHPLSHCDVGIVGNHAQSQLTPAVISVEVSIFNLRLFVQSLAELVARTKTQSLVKKNT